MRKFFHVVEMVGTLAKTDYLQPRQASHRLLFSLVVLDDDYMSTIQCIYSNIYTLEICHKMQSYPLLLICWPIRATLSIQIW